MTKWAYEVVVVEVSRGDCGVGVVKEMVVEVAVIVMVVYVVVIVVIAMMLMAMTAVEPMVTVVGLEVNKMVMVR